MAGGIHSLWDGPVYIPYLGRTLASGLAAGDLHAPVMSFVLICVLPTPAAYGCQANTLFPYVLLCRHPLTGYRARYHCQAQLLPRPLRCRPPLALALLRATGPGCLRCPPPLLPSGGCSEDLQDEPSWLSPASPKTQNDENETTMPDGSRPLSTRRLARPCSCWNPDKYRLRVYRLLPLLCSLSYFKLVSSYPSLPYRNILSFW